MSTISASTTSTTAYKVTADTTGTLVFQTGASPTTAMTLSSAQVVTFANPPTATGAGSVATNTAYGTGALAVNTTGSYNTAVGNNAMVSNLGGAGNSAFGTATLYANTSGTENTAIGGASSTYAALRFNTSGSNNTAVGSGALALNTTSSNNTALGYKAGYTQTTSLGNTFIGYQAGVSHDAVGDGYNTAIGNTALASLTSGVRNTALGTDSGSQITTGSKNTILGRYNGNQNSLDIRTASNWVVLSDGDGSPRGGWNSSGVFFTGGVVPDMTTGYGIALNPAGGAQVRWNNDGGVSDANAVVGRANSVDKFYVKSATGAVQNSTNSYGGISDLRLKENVTDATPKLAELQQVRIVNFNLINDVNKEKQIGVIAQELELIFPSLVDTSIDKDNDGNDLGTTTKTVKYSVFVPMLIKAIQELKAELDAAKADIATLKGAA